MPRGELGERCGRGSIGRGGCSVRGLAERRLGRARDEARWAGLGSAWEGPGAALGESAGDAMLDARLRKPLGTRPPSCRQMKRRQGSVRRSGPAIAHCGNQPAIGQRRGSQRASSPHSTPASPPSSGRGTPALPDPAHRGSHRIDCTSARPSQPRSLSPSKRGVAAMQRRLLPAAAALLLALAALLPAASGYEFDMVRRRPAAAGGGTAGLGGEGSLTIMHPDGCCSAVAACPDAQYIAAEAGLHPLGRQRRLLRRLAPVRLDAPSCPLLPLQPPAATLCTTAAMLAPLLPRRCSKPSASWRT